MKWYILCHVLHAPRVKCLFFLYEANDAFASQNSIIVDNSTIYRDQRADILSLLKKEKTREREREGHALITSSLSKLISHFVQRVRTAKIKLSIEITMYVRRDLRSCQSFLIVNIRSILWNENGRCRSITHGEVKERISYICAHICSTFPAFCLKVTE